MPAFNAIGMDAIGVATTTSSSGQTLLTCSMLSVSTTSAALKTSIVFSASISSSSSTTAVLNASTILLSVALLSQSVVTGLVNTGIRLQAIVQSSSTLGINSIYNVALLTATISSSSTITGDLTTAQAIPMFTPSSARTIFVQAASPLFTGGKWWTLTDPKKPRGLKDPEAIIDITFDWTSWLDDIGSVQISDVTFTLNGVSSVGSFSDGTKVTVFVSGGTAGSSATVSCKIKTLTTPSRTDERTIYIDIADE